MGQIMVRLIVHHWDNLMLFLKAKRFLWMHFAMVIGFTQGDPAYHMIFNIVVDAAVWATLEVV